MTPLVNVNGSAYSVRATATQRIISRVVARPFVRGPGPGLGRNGRVFEITPEVVVPSDLGNDYGFSTWVGLNPESNVNFQVGYSRSVPYQFDSIFFGMGFRMGSLRK